MLLFFKFVKDVERKLGDTVMLNTKSQILFTYRKKHFNNLVKVEISVGLSKKMQNLSLYIWGLPYSSQKVITINYRDLHLFGLNKRFPLLNRPIKFLLL